MGYASTYEKDLNIIVKNGLILRIKEIKNLYRDPHRLPRNNKILIVDSLMNTINKQINWTRVPVEDDIEWSEDFEIKFSKNGKLIRVKNIDWVWCGFKRSIKKSLKGFPKIEIFKIEGEKQSEIFKLELTFNYMGKKIFLDNRFFYGN